MQEMKFWVNVLRAEFIFSSVDALVANDLT